VESCCEFGIELSSGLTSSGLSVSAQLHIVSLVIYVYIYILSLILFTICTSTFSKLCITYTVTCRRVLSNAPL
jgi:hypothetical protein